MSYILEALKKSERERQLGQAPALADVVSAGAASSKRRGWLWSGVAGVLLIFNGALLFYVWQSGRGAAPSVTPAPAASSPPVALQPATQAVPTAAEAETEAMARKLIELESRITQMDASTRSLSSGESDTSIPKGDSEVSGEFATPSPVTKKPLDVQDKFAPKPDRKTATKREPLVSDEARLPARNSEAERRSGEKSMEDDMPERIRSKMNSLKINMLAYSSQPQERFAVIDMVKYTEGERLPNGAELLEIRADSVVVKVDGVKYRVSNH